MHAWLATSVHALTTYLIHAGQSEEEPTLCQNHGQATQEFFRVCHLLL